MIIFDNNAIGHLWEKIKEYATLYYVKKTTTINEKALSSDIVINADEIKTTSTSTTTVKEDIDTITTDYLPVTAGATKPMQNSIWFNKDSAQVSLRNLSIEQGVAPAADTDASQFGANKFAYKADGTTQYLVDGSSKIKLIGKTDSTNIAYFTNGLSTNGRAHSQTDLSTAGWVISADGYIHSNETNSSKNAAIRFNSNGSTNLATIRFSKGKTADREITLPDNSGYLVSFAYSPTVTDTSNGITISDIRKIGPLVTIYLKLSKDTGVAANKSYATVDAFIPQNLRPTATVAVPKITQSGGSPDKTYGYRCMVSASGKVTVTIGAPLTADAYFYGTYFCKPAFYNDFT